MKALYEVDEDTSMGPIEGLEYTTKTLLEAAKIAGIEVEELPTTQRGIPVSTPVHPVFMNFS